MNDNKIIRSFDTGATRDTGEGKLMYDKFLSPTVLKQFAKFMNMNRLQSDGQLRDGDNWQKGIPMDVYLGSLARHYMEFWTETREDFPMRIEMMAACCGMLFNIMGYMHEWLKTHEMVDFDGDEATHEISIRKNKIQEDRECSCGCGRDDGECDGMSSRNDDEPVCTCCPGDGCDCVPSKPDMVGQDGMDELCQGDCGELKGMCNCGYNDSVATSPYVYLRGWLMHTGRSTRPC